MMMKKAEPLKGPDGKPIRTKRRTLINIPVEIQDKIVLKLSQGITLTKILKGKGMPGVVRVYEQIQYDETFAEKVSRARQLGHDAIADSLIELADTMHVAETVEEGPYGRKVTKSDALGHRRLQIGTRLQLLAAWSPKRYGKNAVQETVEDKEIKVDGGLPD
jgi:hypothetical protein